MMENRIGLGRQQGVLFKATVLATALALAGCGGGASDSIAKSVGNNTGGTNTPKSALSVKLIAKDKTSLKVTGDKMQITLQAVNALGGGVSGQDITLAVQDAFKTGVSIEGGNVQSSDANGYVTFSVVLVPGANVNQQDLLDNGIMVAAVLTDSTGAQSTPLSLNLDVSSSGEVSSNYALTINTDKPQLKVTGGTFAVTVALRDSNGGGISGESVSLGVLDALKNGLSIQGSSTATTSETGEAVFNLSYAPPSAAVQADLLNKGITLSATSPKASTSVVMTLPVVTETTTDVSIAAYQSTSSLPTGGGDTEITFRVTDLNGGVMPNVPVNLSILNPQKVGASLGTPSVVTTDASGVAKTSIRLGAESLNHRINHEIQLTAAVRDASGKNVVASQVVTIQATGTTLNLEANKTVVNAGEDLVVTGYARDGKGVSIAGADVAILSESGTEVARAKTNVDGKVSITIPASSLTPNAQSNIVLTGRLYGSTPDVYQNATAPIQLASSSQDFSFASIDSDVLVNTPAKIVLQVKGKTQAEVVGKTVRLLTTQGALDASSKTIASATLVNGLYIGTVTFNLTSTSPGLANLSAYLGTSRITGQVNVVSQVADKLVLQAEETTLAPKATTRIVAIVKDANDAPVEGVRVLFSRQQDASAGSLSSPEAVTDASGTAVVNYTAGSAPTPVDGVQILATLEKPVPLTVNYNLLKLTVAKPAAFITLSYSDKLGRDSRDIYYQWPFSATVVDGAGRPVSNQTVSLSLVPTHYYRGGYRLETIILANQIVGSWVRYATPDPGCRSEDTNRNGILDAGEDLNQNWKLDPRNPLQVIGGTVNADGTVSFRTDAEGKFGFRVDYGKNFAQWLRFDMRVSTLVSGTEYFYKTSLVPPVLADDVDASPASARRPNVLSPYGTWKQPVTNPPVPLDCTEADPLDPDAGGPNPFQQP